MGLLLPSCAPKWWAVLGSNRWPLPCETGGRGLRIKDMRAQNHFATATCHHLMSFDITQCHFRSVPELSQYLRRLPGGSWRGGLLRRRNALSSAALGKMRTEIIPEKAGPFSHGS